MKKIEIIGRVTKDVELVTRNFGGEEHVVANFNVAVNNRKNTGKVDESGKAIYEETEPDFYQIAIWDRYAKAMAPHLTQGRQIFACADSFKLKTWVNREGKLMPTVQMTNPTIELLGANAKKASEEPTATEDDLPFAD